MRVTWIVFLAAFLGPTPVRNFVALLVVAASALTAAAGDGDQWTLDIGEIRYAGEEVYATPFNDHLPSYFHAPAQYHGDWSGFRAIVFEKQSSGGSYMSAYYDNFDGDVVVKNGDLRATYEIPEHHTGEWSTFRVPLDDPVWALQGGAKSLAEILDNFTSFQIRAEYGSGTDRSAIRNVEIES